MESSDDDIRDSDEGSISDDSEQFEDAEEYLPDKINPDAIIREIKQNQSKAKVC